MIPGVTVRCVLCPSPPLFWVAGTTTTRTGWPASCCPPATGPSWHQRCIGRRRCCCRRGETGGGGNEAHGIPGRGEEDKYRGWKVQCRVDEVQCGWEEEEGESIGSRTRDMVPGAGCKLVAAGNGDGRGPGDRAADAPPSHFGEGGLSSRPPLTVVYYP
jgi:hypothetical protein